MFGWKKRNAKVYVHSNLRNRKSKKFETSE